jgi:glycosyltransferase involved in cell wall biosynthesis
MRIGMYNRWLSTLGGGERHSLAIAEYLSRFHEVEVINHKDVSVEEASTRLNLDLKNVTFVKIPDCSNEELIPITANYDFFINASYMDFFPSKAKYSATLIFFPTPLEIGHAIRRNRQIKLFVRRLLRVPSFVDGIYTLDHKSKPLSRLLKPEAKIRLPANKRKYRVWFDLAAYDNLTCKVSISLDGQLLETLEVIHHNPVSYALEIPATNSSMYHELGINAQDVSESQANTSPSMILTRFRVSLPRTYFYYLLFECVYKGLAWRLHFVPPATFSIFESLQTYDLIWANSEYSNRWIKKYWGLSSEILYPPVAIDDFKPSAKKNYILSVGRFFAGGHNKKHTTMITVFKEMVDQGLSDWELHLAGGSTEGFIHQEYLETIRDDSRGYPIFIHADIQFQELVKLYGESSIYWHASGYGEDEEQEPAKFEHFGITTVEAMASGCVPVVISRGGQKEIVNHGEDGFLWESLKQLKELTFSLIDDDHLLRRMSKSARRGCVKYDKIHFTTSLKKQLTSIMMFEAP